MSLPRYPKYKDAGAKWFREVPEHWSVMPLKHAANLRSGGTPSKTNLAYWDGGDIPWASSKDLKAEVLTDTEDHITQLAIDEGAAELVPAGSLLIVVRGMILLHSFPVVRALVPMAINQDLKAVTPRKNLSLNFLSWLLRGASRESLGRTDEAAHGTTVLRMEAWTSIELPIPPFTEQTTIAALLDRETAKIDALVAEQRRLVELLKEKRQAVVSHAVTKGLNPRAPMRNSGIEWLGEVPAHWRIVPLGKVTTSRCDGPFGSGLKSEHYTEAGVRVVRLQNIRHNQFDGSHASFVDLDYYKRELRGHDVISGDVLIAGLGDDNNTVGRSCVAPAGIEPAMVKADCFRYRLDTEQAFPEFVATALSAGARADAGVLSSGSTRSRIPLSVMSTRKLALPPLDEQMEIAALAHAEALKIDALATEAQGIIKLLQERRTALISAAVTGQIDVRQVPATVDSAAGAVCA